MPGSPDQLLTHVTQQPKSKSLQTVIYHLRLLGAAACSGRDYRHTHYLCSTTGH